MLVGMCTCECHGCYDLIAKITTNSRTTKWIIMKEHNRKVRRTFSFNAKEYKKIIEGLFEQYYSYSWETGEDKIRRLCSEYIRTFTTKDGIPIEGVKIYKKLDNNLNKTLQELGDTIEIYYYSNWESMGEGIGRPYKNWSIHFDGKTLESAMKALENFSAKNLVKNDNYIAKRKELFKLPHTKEKEQTNKILLENNDPPEKQLTWDDIENQLRNSEKDSSDVTDEEKLNYFKKKILDHLDNLQQEVDKKKIIPFPTKPKERDG